MTLDDLRARLVRLNALSRGLHKELHLMRSEDAPLLRVDRQAYLAAIARAHSGVEEARVTLARAVMRLEG